VKPFEAKRGEIAAVIHEPTSTGRTSMKGLHHFGITVRDLDESIRFYHDILGLGFVSEPSPWFDGPDLARGVGVPGAALRQVGFDAGGTMLELLQYASPPSETSGPLLSSNLGASHVAFLVDDVEAKKAELEAKGVEFYSEINVVEEGVLAGWRWVYFSDPDGYPLELVEIAYTRPEVREQAVAAYLASRDS
jgi:catechol 2,3-dioxygenase-like lactoylglutathione lyase family enzyme